MPKHAAKRTSAIKPIALVLAIAVVLACAILLGSGRNTATTTTTSVPSSTTINQVANTPRTSVYPPANELADVAAVYPGATFGTFSCNFKSDCVVVHTKYCFNNDASQQACINRASSAAYASSYATYLANGPSICAMYFAEANVSCSCMVQGCSLVYATSPPNINGPV